MHLKLQVTGAYQVRDDALAPNDHLSLMQPASFQSAN